MQNTFFVYIAKCADKTLYIGFTTNLIEREKEHNGVGKTGAKYTRSRRPVKIVYSETFNSKSEALKRELALKKLSHAQKLALI